MFEPMKARNTGPESKRSEKVEWIFYQMTRLQKQIVDAISLCGDCGANKQAIILQLAEQSVYGSCHDFEDSSLQKFVKLSMPKYERNFKDLVKAKILVCVNRRNSIYTINDSIKEAF